MPYGAVSAWQEAFLYLPLPANTLSQRSSFPTLMFTAVALCPPVQSICLQGSAGDTLQCLGLALQDTALMEERDLPYISCI